VSRLIETHSARNPRLLLFFGIVSGLLLVLVGGLAYRQLLKTGLYNERERLQNQRRVIVPGPRGNIYDRNGVLLVRNRPRFSVVLNLAELRGEFRGEYKKIERNYSKMEKGERPNSDQMARIARASVAQRYLDKINTILGRTETVRTEELNRHVNQTLLLPYVLLDDLAPNEYARLIERLPVTSPLQVYTSSTRDYPYKSAAAHVLGYTGIDDDPVVEDFPGDDLLTFKMKGSFGRDGMEKKFNDLLQGESGGAIYRVDPAGYRVDLPVEQRLPVQGKNITTSLDIDLQLAAEEALGDQSGAAVAIDIKTGEVLVLTSKPDYNLADTTPRISHETWQDILDRGALLNQAIGGAYPPGSTFKLVTSIAGLRSGKLTPDQVIADCEGSLKVGNKMFYCDNGEAHHGKVTLAEAIAQSCDVYFYQAGLLITPDVIAAEARRFHLDQPTGIELPNETSRMTIPDPDWKQRTQNERWFPGDTANMSIGQGFVLVTPLDMACFAASIARNEVYTKPTLLHDPHAPVQHTESIGLTPAQRAALLEGMEGTTTHGTAKLMTKPGFKIPNLRIGGKTGTAQKRITKDGKVGNINFAWFIGFAPLENPEIAVAVMIEGDTIGETFGGGLHSAPVANTIFAKYFEKKNKPPAIPVASFKVQ
jgi:penicillin-binding protein 2